MEQKLAYLYPRLDANVSMQLNHLLKAPFCVHPDTGRNSILPPVLPSLGKICIALDPNEVDRFDPSAVPKIQEVCVSGGANLGPSLATFDSFIRNLEASKRKEISEKRQLHEASLSF